MNKKIPDPSNTTHKGRRPLPSPTPYVELKHLRGRTWMYSVVDGIVRVGDYPTGWSRLRAKNREKAEEKARAILSDYLNRMSERADVIKVRLLDEDDA